MERRRVVFLALCALLLGMASAEALTPHDRAEGPRQQQIVSEIAKTIQKQELPRANDLRTSDQPPVSETRSSGKGQQEIEMDQSDRRSKSWYDRAGLIIGITTSCIVLSQTLILGVQARRSRETILAMREIAIRQSEDMRNSLRVATDSALAAKQSADWLTEAERPHMLVSDYQFTANEPIVGGAILACTKIVMTNFGKTPSIIKTYTHCIMITDDPLEEPPDFSKMQERREILPPQGNMEIKHDFPIPISEWNDILMQKKRVYLAGQIIYKDIFGKTHKHGFCYLALFGEEQGKSISFGPSTFWIYT